MKISIRFLAFFFIANIYFFLSNITLITLSARTPKDTLFPLYHSNFSYDYNVYLSVITQGQNGSWLFRDPFTSEETKPGIFYLYYILLGKIPGLSHLFPPYVYHLARIVSVELFIVAIFLLSRFFLGKNTGFLASLTAIVATFSPPFLYGEKEALVTYSPWWESLEALKRLDWLPHYIFGEALLLFSLIFIGSYLKTQKNRHLIASIVSIIIGGIVLPPSMIPLVFGIPIAYVFLLARNNLTNLSNYTYSKLPRLKSLLIIWLAALLPLFLSFWQTKQGYPWIVWITWEIAQWNRNSNFDKALFLSFGLLPILSIPAIIRNLKKGSFNEVFTVSWAFLPLLLLPFASLLGIGKIRLTYAAPFVPFALLYASYLGSLKPKLKVVYILFLLASALPVTASLLETNIKKSQTSPLYGNIFIHKSIWGVISFIDKNIPKNSIILSNESIGNIIPAYTPTISYFGHINQTMNFDKKQDNVRKFYSGEFSPREAQEFLRQNNISYVYFGPQERALGSQNLDLPFLSPVFQTGEIIFYRVKERV